MMEDFSKKAKLRIAELKQRIPFDDLEPKSSIEVGGSSSKSLAESTMYDNGISGQDLKKGNLEKNEEKIEDIEKRMKEEAAAMEEDKEMYGELDESSIAFYNHYYEMAKEKDKEMYGDLDNIVKKTKMMKKIEKKKIVKHYGDQEKRRETTRPPK